MNKISVSLVLHQSQCSNNCVFCSSRKMGDIEKNMEFELNKLKNIVKTEKIGHIEISGNDPCEFEGLPDFVKKVKTIANPDSLAVSTYGGHLTNKKYLQELIDAGVTRFRIPIYGHTPEIHDAVTRRKGSFRELIQCFKNIRDENIKVDVTTLILRENQDHLKKLIWTFTKMTNFAATFRIGMAGYVFEHPTFIKSMPNFERLKKTLPKALKFALKTGLVVEVADIPYCIIGFDYPYVAKFTMPKKAYEFRRGESRIVEMPSGELLPDYLIKTKTAGCKLCKYDAICEGFFKTYVDRGFFKFSPIIEF